MKKMFFVMNPYAGQKKANRHLTAMIEIFNRGGYDVTVHMTSGTGNAREAVMEKARWMDVIVCCGGDGTFNEVVSGVLSSGVPVPVGYIPAGSTNDFAASLGLATDPLKAAEDIVAGTGEWFDVGSFGGRTFSYVASFGLFTKASYNTPQSVKNALGHTAYILSGIQELSQLKAERVRFELADGTVVEDEFLFGAISNSTSVGGILTLAPDRVDMRDGKLELFLVRAPKDLVELTDCLIRLQNQDYSSPMVTFLSTERVLVTPPASMDWTLDGEREPGKEQVDVQCIQHAFQILRREGKK